MSQRARRHRLTNVGYKSPPPEHRFKPGQSGNPTGRPKGSTNGLAGLNKAFAKKVPVTENGKRRSLTKRALAYTQLANMAAKGDLKALQMLLSCLKMESARQDLKEPPPQARPQATGRVITYCTLPWGWRQIKGLPDSIEAPMADTLDLLLENEQKLKSLPEEQRRALFAAIRTLIEIEAAEEAAARKKLATVSETR